MSEFRRRLIAQESKKVNQFIATYNVTSTSSATRLLGEKFNISQIDKMYIDDVEVALTKLYTFTTTGEHKVRGMMSDNFTSCESMFHGCPIKYLDCTNFDLSKVTTVKFMFYQNNQSAIGGLTDLNTSNVENFSSIFNACQKMGYINISNWNLKGNCSEMFAYDVALGQVVSSADISNVLNFNNAFVTCLNLTAIPNFIGWKQGNLSFSNSASISAVSIHNLINNAKSVADGAIARTLTLNATAKTKWQNSEYYEVDQAMATEKLITIQ
jgi:hypothetical protein